MSSSRRGNLQQGVALCIRHPWLFQLSLSSMQKQLAFHWLLRDAAVCAPHYSLDDLAKLDNRLDAHKVAYMHASW